MIGQITHIFIDQSEDLRASMIPFTSMNATTISIWGMQEPQYQVFDCLWGSASSVSQKMS